MFFFCFFFKQKTAYEMRISDWSSDVCSSDLKVAVAGDRLFDQHLELRVGEEVAPRDVGRPLAERHAARELGRIVGGGRQRRALVLGRHVDASGERRRRGGGDQVTHGRVDRKSVGWGKGVAVRVELGGRRVIKKKKSRRHAQRDVS